MIRHFISVAIFLAGIGWMIITSGGVIWHYLDIPTIIFVVIFPLVFVSILFGFKETAFAFSVSLKREIKKEKLVNALDFFKIYGKTTWIAGFIGAFIGVIAALIYLEDKAALGSNLAIALFSVLYSGVVNVVIITPFIIFIKKKLNLLNNSVDY
ncbi:MAG: MotA/TolQ/ExbB proton channel family protein [Spirochaetaceae bacterium]|jgi:hypothetical protein|nr:MotA/TolQ/ExbB proton channel family protein [Spirochaetaceae bacterium]